MTWQMLFWIELVIYWIAVALLLVAQKRQADQIRAYQKKLGVLTEENLKLRQSTALNPDLRTKVTERHHHGRRIHPGPEGDLGG